MKYNKNCGLSENEFELEKIVDEIKQEPSTLKCIAILKTLQMKQNNDKFENDFEKSFWNASADFKIKEGANIYDATIYADNLLQELRKRIDTTLPNSNHFTDEEVEMFKSLQVNVQRKYYKEILEKTNINIVLCPKCGATLLHRIGLMELQCTSCKCIASIEHFTDLYD